MDVTAGPDAGPVEPGAVDGSAAIRLEKVSKTYPGGTVAVAELDLDIPAGELVCLIGPSGCGKTTTMKMINRLVESSSGRIFLGGRGHHHGQRRPAAPAHRVRHPAGRPVRPPDDRGQRRDRAPAARLGPGPDPHPGLGAAGAGRAGPGHLRQALPGAAVRRAAAARRGGPGAGRRPAGAADGRAVQRDRPDRPGPAAGGVPPDPGRGPQDHRVRHPRRRGGGPARRPDRGLPAGRPPGAVRHAGAGARRAGVRVRGGLRRCRPRVAPAGGHRDHRRRPGAAAGGGHRRHRRGRAAGHARGALGGRARLGRVAARLGEGLDAHPADRTRAVRSPTSPDASTPRCRSTRR